MNTATDGGHATKKFDSKSTDQFKKKVVTDGTTDDGTIQFNGQSFSKGNPMDTFKLKSEIKTLQNTPDSKINIKGKDYPTNSRIAQIEMMQIKAQLENPTLDTNTINKIVKDTYFSVTDGHPAPAKAITEAA